MAEQELQRQLELILSKLEELEAPLERIHKNLQEMTKSFNTYKQVDQPITRYYDEDANSEKRRPE